MIPACGSRCSSRQEASNGKRKRTVSCPVIHFDSPLPCISLFTSSLEKLKTRRCTTAARPAKEDVSSVSPSARNGLHLCEAAIHKQFRSRAVRPALMWCLLNSWTFVALKLGCGKARGGRIPAVGCNRRATQPQLNFSATRRAAVLFRGDFVAHSLQIAAPSCRTD